MRPRRVAIVFDLTPSMTFRLPNTFERGFCASIATQLRYRAPSAIQAAVLHRIFVNRFGGRIA